MKEVNLIVFEGRLTRDPELKETKSGLPKCRFTVANNYSYKKNDTWVNNASFINVTTWSRNAENCARYLKKGRPVRITGRLDQYSYKNDEGRTINLVEVVASNVEFLPANKKEQENESGEMAAEAEKESVA